MIDDSIFNWIYGGISDFECCYFLHKYRIKCRVFYIMWFNIEYYLSEMIIGNERKLVLHEGI